MTDNAKLFTIITPPLIVVNQIYSVFTYKGIEFHPIKSRDFIYYIGNYKNLRLKIYGDKLMTDGSLCKAYHGYNHQNFRLKELQSTKRELESLLSIDAKNMKVLKFETGIVLDTTDKNIQFSDFGMYKKIQPEAMRSKGRMYGLQYQNTTHKLKLYDKTYEAKRNSIYLDRQYLRIEKCVSTWALRKTKAFKHLKLNSLEDLCTVQVQHALFEDLYDSISKIEFLDMNMFKTLSVREIRVYSYMNNEKFRKVVSKNFKSAYRNDSSVFKNCIEKLQTNTQREFLKSIKNLQEYLFFGTCYLDQNKGTVTPIKPININTKKQQ